MRKLFYILGLLIYSALISCGIDESELECNLSHQGRIIDWTGVDGCGFLIESDTVTYEVLNWDDLNFIPKDNTKVCFDYELVESASICMVGYTIHLTDCQSIE